MQTRGRIRRRRSQSDDEEDEADSGPPRKEQKTHGVPAPSDKNAADGFLWLPEHVASLQGTMTLQNAASIATHEALNGQMLAGIKAQFTDVLIARRNCSGLRERLRRSAEDSKKQYEKSCGLELRANTAEAKVKELAEKFENLEARLREDMKERESAVMMLQERLTQVVGPQAAGIIAGDVDADRRFLEECDEYNDFGGARASFCDLVDGMIKEGAARQEEHKSITALRNAALITRAVRMTAESDKKTMIVRGHYAAEQRSNEARLTKIKGQSGLIGRLKHGHAVLEAAHVKKDREWRRRWEVSLRKRDDYEAYRDDLEGRHEITLSQNTALSAKLKEMSTRNDEDREASKGKDLAIAELAKTASTGRLALTEMAKAIARLQDLELV
jgi:hypothetical protein